MTTKNAAVESPNANLTIHELELFAGHLRDIYTLSGRWGMQVHERHELANVEILPIDSAPGALSVWDSVTINGHSCGNRCGGAKAYARLVAGDPNWMRAGD